MISFWEKNSFLNYDTIVIGGGFNGLSAACAIKEKYPKQNILILERGSWPFGASTRNAGFACFGSFAEIRSDIQSNGLDLALQLIEMRNRGLEIHKKRIGEEQMGYEKTGGGEFIFKDESFFEDEVREMNHHLSSIFKTEVFKIENDKISENGFNRNDLNVFISNFCEGQVDTGKFMLNLWQYAMSLGVKIMTGITVESIEDLPASCNVIAQHNRFDETVNFTCEQCVVCTNAFSKTFFPDFDIHPGRGQILATKPIPGLKFKGIFHFREGYYYFRNYGERIIFGGGRNEDIKGEETTDIEINTEIKNSLDHYLKTLIIPEVEYEVDCRWAGIMAFGTDKLPIIERVSNRVIAGVRMGGMGVALSGITSQKIAEMI